MFKDPTVRLAAIGQAVKKYHPGFKAWQHCYRKLLKQHTLKKVVLDAGCGKGGIIAEFKNQTKQIIGLDDDASLLRDNTVVDEKIVSKLDKIPLINNIIDTAVATFVIEHVASPDKMFKEIFRILKPDGKFIFITTNLFNPIMAVSRILPYSLHKLLRKKLLHKSGEGTYKTYYQANSYHSLAKLANQVGFKKINILRVGNPEYLAFHPLTIPLAVYFEKLIDNKYLDFSKMYLIGFCQK